jgi:hypothetical protein
VTGQRIVRNRELEWWWQWVTEEGRRGWGNLLRERWGTRAEGTTSGGTRKLGEEVEGEKMEARGGAPAPFLC